MASARGKGRSGKRRRRAALIVAFLVALAVVAVAVLWLRVSTSRKTPQRLDLLYAAWNEFNTKNYDRATALLDRRAADHEPTPLDWMLRARIAESQGRLVEALGHLKHIPDSDLFSSQAWLKAGQIELARHNRAGPSRRFAARWHSIPTRSRRIVSWPTSTRFSVGGRNATPSSAPWPNGCPWITFLRSPGARITAASGIPTKLAGFSAGSSSLTLMTGYAGSHWRLISVWPTGSTRRKPLFVRCLIRTPKPGRCGLRLRSTGGISIQRRPSPAGGLLITCDSMAFAVDWH